MPPRPTIRWIWNEPTLAPISGSACAAGGSAPPSPAPNWSVRPAQAGHGSPGPCGPPPQVGHFGGALLLVGSATLTPIGSVTDTRANSCPAQGVRAAAAARRRRFPLTVPG